MGGGGGVLITTDFGVVIGTIKGLGGSGFLGFISSYSELGLRESGNALFNDIKRP